MKKLFSLLTLLMLLSLVFTGCDGNGGSDGTEGGGHTHKYTEKLTYAEGAEIIAPTCTSGGKYYYVCTCGKLGTETHETGFSSHNFTKKIEDEEHLASEASCQGAAKYYYSCFYCGEISEDLTYFSGSRLEHSYVDNVCIYGCGEELNKYTLSDGGDYYTLTLFREKLQVATVPAEYKGLPVKAIGSHAFSGNDVKEVILPESITVLERSAFYSLETLEKINLENVELIGEYAFDGCELLSEVEFNSRVKLGEYCFARTGLQSVTIPEDIDRIGVGAFSQCSALSEIYYNAKNADDIEYPSSVFPSNDDEANAITLYVGNSVERIPASFFNESKVADIVIHDECNSLTIGEYAFYEASLPIELTLERVAVVGARAFGKTGITKLTLDGHIDLVGDYAFGSCASLTEVTIMKNRGRFGNVIFANCEGLQTVYYRHEGEEVLGRAIDATGSDNLKLVIGSNVKTIPDNFDGSDIAFLEFESGAENVTIGDHAFAADIRGELDLSCVKSIADRAFKFTVTGIDKLILSEGLESLGREAFYKVNRVEFLARNCADVPFTGGSNRTPAFAEIGSICFGEKVEYIPANIFYGITIGTVSFANNLFLYEIGDYSFYAARVGSLSLPEEVKTVGDYSFYNVETPSSFLDLTKVKEFGEYSFAYFVGNLKLSGTAAALLPAGAFTSTGISGELDLSRVRVIGEGCFEDCVGITKLIIGEDFSTMDVRAFEDCVGLTEVVFNAKNATEYTEGNPSFFASTKSTQGFKLTVGKFVTRIPSHLFKQSAVKEIVFEDESSCAVIGQYAFAYTDRLELAHVELPDSLEILDHYAFVLSKVRSITLGSGIKYIGANALYSMGVIEGEGTRDYGFLEEVFFTADVELKAYSYDSETGLVTDIGETLVFEANNSEKAQEYAKLLYRANMLYLVEAEAA